MKTPVLPDVEADLELLCESIATGRPANADVARRVRDRSEKVRAELKGPMNVAVDLLRETRDE